MKKYHGIQVLRFVAAGLVVLAHMNGNVLHNWHDFHQMVVPPFGDVGVFVFFGISGFIMVSTQYDSFGRDGSAAEFAIRRLLRVWPIYAIGTVLQYINKYNFNDNYTWLNFVKSLAFIPYIGDSNMYRPVLGQGWTLNIEMFFYAVFAVCLLCRRTVGLAICIGIFVLFPLLSNVDLRAHEILDFYADRILMYFVCGMLVALLHRRFAVQFEGWVLPLTACLALMGGALAIPYMDGIPSAVAFTYNLLMVFCVVWLAASYRVTEHSKTVGFFERLGDASYSTYLFHGFVVGALKVIAYRVPEGNYLLVTVACIIGLIASNAAGLFAYKYLELPIAKAVRGFTWIPGHRKSVTPLKKGTP